MIPRAEAGNALQDNNLTCAHPPASPYASPFSPENAPEPAPADPPENAPDAPPADPVIDGLARSLEWLTPEQRAALVRLLMEGEEGKQ
jgi:hypothetical protein